MPSKIHYLKYIFLGLLLVGCSVFTGYDLLYGKPKIKCDNAGGWWHWQDRKCYTPLYLPTLTGRKPGEPARIDWHDKKAESPAAAAKAPEPAKK